MALTEDQYYSNLEKHANWFVAGMTELQNEWQSRIGTEITAAKLAKLPDEIIADGAKKAMEMIDAGADELR